MRNSQLALGRQGFVNRRRCDTQCSPPGVSDGTCLDELWRDELHPVGRDRESDAIGRGLKLWINGRGSRNPDYLTLQIDQSTTAIAWIDGCIGLNGIGDRANHTIKCANDPARDGLGDSEGVANRKNVLPNL